MRPFDFESFFAGLTGAEDSPLEAFSLGDSSLEAFLAAGFLVEAFLAATFLATGFLAATFLATGFLAADSLAADFLALPEAFLLFLSVFSPSLWSAFSTTFLSVSFLVAIEAIPFSALRLTHH